MTHTPFAALISALSLAAPTAAAPASWKLAREVSVLRGTMVVAYLDDQNGLMTGCPAWRDVGGGATWVEEQVSTPFHAAVVTLSQDGKILSALDTGGATIKVYRAE